MPGEPLHPFVRSLLQQVDRLDAAERQACGELLQLEARGMLANMTDEAVQAMYRAGVARYQARTEPSVRRATLWASPAATPVHARPGGIAGTSH